MIPESAPYFYKHFWEDFRLIGGNSSASARLPDSYQKKYLPIAVGRKGFSVNLDIDRKSSRVECQLWISGDRAKEPKSKYKHLEDVARNRLGEIMFDNSNKGKAYKIFQTHSCELSDSNERTAAMEWLKERSEEYVEVFRPLVKDL